MERTYPFSRITTESQGNLTSQYAPAEAHEFRTTISFVNSADGMIPFAASITVMLLALSIGQTGMGLLTVFRSSLGIAITLVGICLLVVANLSE